MLAEVLEIDAVAVGTPEPEQPRIEPSPERGLTDRRPQWQPETSMEGQPAAEPLRSFDWSHFGSVCNFRRAEESGGFGTLIRLNQTPRQCSGARLKPSGMKSRCGLNLLPSSHRHACSPSHASGTSIALIHFHPIKSPAHQSCRATVEEAGTASSACQPPLPRQTSQLLGEQQSSASSGSQSAPEQQSSKQPASRPTPPHCQHSIHSSSIGISRSFTRCCLRRRTCRRRRECAARPSPRIQD